MAKASDDQIRSVRLELIDEPTGRIRLDVSEEGVKELAASIEGIGLLQAILLRKAGSRFEVVFGHRRFLAFKSLGREEIPAVVKELDDVEVALMRATENVAREDVSPIEEGAVYVDLREEHGLTLDEISKRMRKSVGVIKRRMDLLKMPDCLQKAIHFGQIKYSVGEVLWSLGDVDRISYFLGFAVDHGASRSVVQGWVHDEKKRRRLDTATGGGGGSPENPMQTRPVYVPCDVCLGSMEIGKETIIRACETCVKLITQAMKA